MTMEVSCEQIRDALQAGRTPGGPAVHEHLAACEACSALVAGGRELADLLAEGGAEPLPKLAPPPTGWRERLRQLPTRTRALLVLAVAGVVTALNALLLLRPDMDAYPSLRMASVVGGTAILAVGLLRIAMRPLHRPLLDRRLLAGAALAGVLLVVGTGLLPPAHHAHAAHPESFVGMGSAFWAAALQCLVYGSVMALPVFLALLVLDRGAPTTPLVLGGLAFSSLVGSLALQLHCPIVDPAHLVFGHGSVPALFVGAGAAFLLARRLRGRRRA